MDRGLCSTPGCEFDRHDLKAHPCGKRVNLLPSEIQKAMTARYSRMRSVGDRVLVKADEIRGEQVTAGGIIKPSTAREARPLRFGQVLSVGSAVEQVKAGDRIAWRTQDGDFADGDLGYELMSLHERDVCMVLEG